MNKKKENSNDGILYLQDFEAIMNKESLKRLPLLVNAMDENLSINIVEFINNPVMIEFKLHQHKLIEVIKSSNKFHYDNKTGMIKFKEKADRNILIVSNFVYEADTSEDKEAKEKYVYRLIEDNCKNYYKKIKKINYVPVSETFHFIFEHEDYSMEVEKCLNNLLETEKGQGENEFDKHFKSDAKIFLAAESLKRRITANFDPMFSSLYNQVQFLKTIIKNPTNFIPRRYTINDKAIYENQFKQHKDTEHQRSSCNLDDKSSQESNRNKFDLLNGKLSEIQVNLNLDAKEFIPKESRQSKRTSIYSNHRRSSFMHKKKKPSLQNEEDKVLSYKKRNGSFNIQNSYKLKDIAFVFLLLKTTKNYQFPEEFKSNFIQEAMTEKIRSNLDVEAVHGEVLTRNRSRTDNRKSRGKA